MFLFGSNSKKHPDSLIFGRLFDYQLLDMVDLKMKSFVSSKEFDAPGPTLCSKPCIMLQGTLFETDENLKRIGNLMVDFFRGPTVSTVRLQGLELIISLTAVSEKEISFRVYR